MPGARWSAVWLVLDTLLSTSTERMACGALHIVSRPEAFKHLVSLLVPLRTCAKEAGM